MTHPEREEEQVNLLLRKGVNTVEASAFMGVTPALIKYRAHGLKRSSDGRVSATNRIIAKVSRPEVAEAFLSPAPEFMVEKMLKENKITSVQAELLKKYPLQRICALRLIRVVIQMRVWRMSCCLPWFVFAIQ